MKKKILLLTVLVIALTCIFAISVSAAGVHDSVDKTQKVTLSDGTTVNLFDADGNALIWYMDNSGTLKSIRADIGIEGTDKVDFHIQTWAGSIQGLNAYQIDDITITADGNTYDDKSIVVFNIMDDDVLVTSSALTNSTGVGQPVNCMQQLFNNKTNILEYAFLRLDTVAIQKAAFQNSSKLKYINLADLYTLKQFADSCFQDCSSLGPDLVIPNTVTAIGTACFRGCSSLQTARLGASVSSCGSWDFFMNCTSLTTMYIPGTLTNITINSFKGTSNIKTIYYTGTLDQANTFISKATSSTGNTTITSHTIISYTDYEKLADKTGNYLIYGYSICEAFYDGKHVVEGEGTLGFLGDKYTSAFASVTPCSREYCNDDAINEICGALFVNKGYSKVADGTSFTYGIVINEDNIATYLEKTGESTFNYGVIVGAANFDADGNLVETSAIIDATGKALIEKSIVIDFAKVELTNFTIYNVKMVGIETETQQKLPIYCCAYIIDGASVSYVGNTVSTSAATISSATIENVETTTPLATGDETQA